MSAGDPSDRSLNVQGDIVSKLRSDLEDYTFTGLMTLCVEAADEIERLREENEVLQSLANGMPVSRPAADEIERLQKYAARLIERLERAPEETRAIDADLTARRKA